MSTPARAPRRASPPLSPAAARLPLPRPAEAHSASGRLRLAAAVSAEISPDGAGLEFEHCRARALRWIETHVGPLPAAFEAGRDLGETGARAARHRGSAALVRAVDRKAGPGRYFGASVEVGTGSGLARWRVVLILFRSREASHLRASLLTPERGAPERASTAWVPGIVRELAAAPGLTDYGCRILSTPWIVHDEAGVEGLIHLIGDRDRTRPVFATGLANSPAGAESAPLDAGDLARRTAGLAHVVVLTGPMTYALSDRVGRRFSVFGNAVRTYRPGCVIGDQSVNHPVALPETVRNWPGRGGRDFVAYLTREAARMSVTRQAARAAWLPEELDPGAPPRLQTPARPDPFTNALSEPAADGDRLHPLGAGEDAPPERSREGPSRAMPVAEAS